LPNKNFKNLINKDIHTSMLLLKNISIVKLLRITEAIGTYLIQVRGQGTKLS